MKRDRKVRPKPPAGKPDAAIPDVGNPPAPKPDAGNPDAAKPAALKPDAGKAPQPARRWGPDLWICLLLLGATLAVYSQVRNYGFVHYDDADYVGKNLHVRAGLTAGGLLWV